MATITGYAPSPDYVRGRPRDPFYDEVLGKAQKEPHKWVVVKCKDFKEVDRVRQGLRKRHLTVAVRDNRLYAQYPNGNGS